MLAYGGDGVFFVFHDAHRNEHAIKYFRSVVMVECIFRPSFMLMIRSCENSGFNHTLLVTFRLLLCLCVFITFFFFHKRKEVDIRINHLN